MVTPTTSMPSFDVYYGLNQPSIPNHGSNNTIIIVALVAGVFVTAGIAYYSITENKRLKQMIEDMKSKRL